jgi:hypothetical protein
MKAGSIVTCWLTALSLFGVAAIRPSSSAAQCCGTEQCGGDFNCDGQVTVDEILAAINNALLGCGPAVSADQACTDSATANCGKLDECVFNGTSIRYGGASTCRTRQTHACLERLGAAGTGNSPPDVELCVSEVPGASCNDFDLGNIAECQAKIGSGPSGGSCAFDGQCMSANCTLINGTNCGHCAAPNQAGDSCASTSCSHGLVCVKSTQLCQPRGIASGSCDADHPCGAGLSCVTPSGAASGTCQAAGSSVGAGCDPKRQTAAGCDPNAGLYCDATTKTCLTVTYATASQPCGLVSGVENVCTNASTCFGAQGQTPGTCMADALDGMPCDSAAGPACIPPATCVTGGGSATTGTCQLPDPSACH